MHQIVVVGAGAAGLAAAIAAAQTAAPDTHVILLDKNPRPGKKLLATGNGRCNLDNIGIAPDKYFTADPAALAPLLHTVNAADPLGWFGELGLLTRTDEAGRVYPYSNQAADVLSLLLLALDALGVEQRMQCRLQELMPTKRGWLVRIVNEAEQEERLTADAVLLALGGKAGPQFGTDGYGPAFARLCGCRTEPLYPCLVPLKCDKSQVRGLSGLRIKADAALYDGSRQLARESGEIQFTDYGLSGIAVMQLSCLLAPGRGPKAPVLALDLFPQWEEEALADLLQKRNAARPRLEPEQYLTGLLAPKAGLALWRAAGLEGRPPHDLTPAQWAALAHTMKHWCFTDLAPCEWKGAQTTGGGVALRELDPGSFALRGCPGVYFVGETVDCAGSCGGFNLHWAFGSGLAAGRHAGQLTRRGQKNAPEGAKRCPGRGQKSPQDNKSKNRI